jgi:dTDP-glucose 4,6-dehydratase
MTNIFITGGAGFIGSNFILNLLKRDPKVSVVNYDLLTYAGNLDNLETVATLERYHFVKGDICDSEALYRIFHEFKVEKVVHFAAESHVDRSISSPMPFIRTNITGTATLLETARRCWLEDKLFPIEQVRFHHVSTDEVFGSLSKGDPAFTEATPYSPNSPYAASKASSDLLVRAYFHTYGLPITISNCSNNYGPYQFPEKLIPLIILNCLSGKPLPVYGDGQQIRDWLYVGDHCDAINQILDKGKAGETYNIGGNNQPANLEIVQTICKTMDELVPSLPTKPCSSLIQFVKDRPGHDRRYAMNINKIQRELNWSPKESLESGLRKTITWYTQHLEWTKKIQDRPDFQAWMKSNYSNRNKKD